MTDMTLREAQADAWEAGEHECQRTGHHFPRSTETNEPLRCTGCGMDPDEYDPDEDDLKICLEVGHGYFLPRSGCRDCQDQEPAEPMDMSGCSRSGDLR